MLVVLLQSAALIAMIGMKQYTLNTGTLVLLETEPIDPQSLFSGDYVILNYKISVLDLKKFGKSLGDFKRHDAIYLTLKPGQPYWQPVSVAREYTMPPRSSVVIKGEIEWTSNNFWNPAT